MYILLLISVLLLLPVFYVIKKSKYNVRLVSTFTLTVLSMLTLLLAIIASDSRSREADIKSAYELGQKDAYINAIKCYNPYNIQVTVKTIKIKGQDIEIQRDTTYTDKYNYLK